mgnify:CR=1 FL=1
MGEELRRRVPRSVHGRWRAAPDRPDPVDVIRARNRGRQQRLVPIRIGRGVTAPVAFSGRMFAAQDAAAFADLWTDIVR